MTALVLEHFERFCRLPNKLNANRNAWSGLVHEDKLTGTVSSFEI